MNAAPFCKGAAEVTRQIHPRDAAQAEPLDPNRQLPNKADTRKRRYPAGSTVVHAAVRDRELPRNCLPSEEAELDLQRWADCDQATARLKIFQGLFNSCAIHFRPMQHGQVEQGPQTLYVITDHRALSDLLNFFQCGRIMAHPYTSIVTTPVRNDETVVCAIRQNTNNQKHMLGCRVRCHHVPAH